MLADVYIAAIFQSVFSMFRQELRVLIAAFYGFFIRD